MGLCVTFFYFFLSSFIELESSELVLFKYACVCHRLWLINLICVRKQKVFCIQTKNPSGSHFLACSSFNKVPHIWWSKKKIEFQFEDFENCGFVIIDLLEGSQILLNDTFYYLQILNKSFNAKMNISFFPCVFNFDLQFRFLCVDTKNGSKNFLGRCVWISFISV